MNKISLYFNTLKYLKLRQIGYRLFYKVHTLLREKMNFKYLLRIQSNSHRIRLDTSIMSKKSFLGERNFVFLNNKHKFSNNIKWNHTENGKLWTYNLNYFDFLQQENISLKDGLALINDFMNNIEIGDPGLEAFPISLRGINWIKYIVQHNLREKNIDDSLYAQYHILMNNIEYHLLGNHLLENGFSLLFGAYYFQDEKFYRKAKKILTDELEEQILKDGAHFELSPMYHQIMLFRILDCINLVENNNWKNQELLSLLIKKAEIMLAWLKAITYEPGNIPLFNDSANKIAPTTKELIDYAKRLHSISDIKQGLLSDSGYRKIKTKYYEMIVDIGQIGPEYIPGHAHSDTFNFELYIDGKPFIVDTGLSTYETNKRRQLERSTCSHNTVEVDGKNQSHIWGGFRVAERAKVIDIIENDGIIKATHNGYRKLGVLHTRSFRCTEESIVIKDALEGSNGHTCIGYLHFYPGINVTTEKNVIQCTNATIEFSGCTRILLDEYEYSPEFNRREKASYVKVFFDHELDTQILLKQYIGLKKHEDN